MNKAVAKKKTGGLDLELVRDVGFLLVAACFVLVNLLEYTLRDALLYAPLVVGAVALGMYLLVQILWIGMRLLDRLCAALHLRRSPLA